MPLRRNAYPPALVASDFLDFSQKTIVETPWFVHGGIFYT
jgi:hypothetical protein